MAALWQAYRESSPQPAVYSHAGLFDGLTRVATASCVIVPVMAAMDLFVSFAWFATFEHKKAQVLSTSSLDSF